MFSLYLFMNKRGDIDLSDPRNWWAIPIILFVLLIMAIFLRQFYIDTTCSDIIRERDSCYTERDGWRDYAISLNDTINNCTSLIQEQRDICEDRINESVTSCETGKENAVNLIIFYKITFILYHALILAIWLPISISLFKVVFKVGWKEEWARRHYKMKRFLLCLKIFFWVIASLLIISYLILFFMANPALP